MSCYTTNSFAQAFYQQEVNPDTQYSALYSARISPPAPRELLRYRRRGRDIKPQKHMCDKCETEGNYAEVYCQDCDLRYCSKCDTEMHQKGNLALHYRKEANVDNGEPSDDEANDLKKGIEQEPQKDSFVRDWLEEINLGQYIPNFDRLQVSKKELMIIDSEEILEDELGIVLRLHRRKLLREIQKLKNSIPSPSYSSPSPHPSNDNDLEHISNKALELVLSPARSSPVASMRARVTHGQQTKGRVTSRPLKAPKLSIQTIEGDKQQTNHQSHFFSQSNEETIASNITKSSTDPLELMIDIKGKVPIPPSSMSASRRNSVNLDDAKNSDSANRRPNLLLLDIADTAASFNFSDEGTLSTHGFEINTEGIANLPQNRKWKSSFGSTGDWDKIILLHELGQGAGGKVYKAIYPPTLRLLAMKVVRIYEQEKRHQMVREICSLSYNQLSLSDYEKKHGACPELVGFYNAFTSPEKGAVSIVLEYMDAGSLEDLIQTGIGCPESTLVNIAYDFLKGLSFLHRQRQLHRDIKPSNILINRAGEVKISDFGISRDLENTQANASTFTGTLFYMAPERIAGLSYSFPSDIWSFGLSLMTCAIGKIPLPVHDGYWGVVSAVKEGQPPKLKDYGDYSPELCDFIDKCLSKDPSKRFSADELLIHPFITNMKQRKKPTLDMTITKGKLSELNVIVTKVYEWIQKMESKADNMHVEERFRRKEFLNDNRKFISLANQLYLPQETVIKAFHSALGKPLVSKNI